MGKVKLEWTTQKIKVSELIELEFNPRKISEEKRKKLIESLEKFNLVEIPAVNTDMKIIGGNQRVKALIIAGRGDELIDVRVPNRTLTEKEVKEYNLISNTHAGEFDFDLIMADFEDINFEDIGFDIGKIEFESSDLFEKSLDKFEKIKDSKKQLEAVEDDFEIPEIINPITVLGDLYEIGEHRLLCGDSTDSDQVAKLMNGEKYDLIVTDPPYNVAYEGKTKDALTIKNDKMKSSDFLQFLTDYFSTTLINTKKGGGIYVFFADMELRSFVDAFLDGGFKLSQQLIWLKQTMVMGRKDYHCKHEPILYGWYEGEAHNWYSDRKQTTILEFDRPQRNGEHPTMKPIKLIEYLINNSSKKNDLIGDGFLGSGSTMVAAHQLKRKCYGMELDPKYCDVIIKRMLNLDPSLVIKRNGKLINNNTYV